MDNCKDNLAVTESKGIKRSVEILLVSTKLGLTSFGGPIAHLGYFHNEYVRKRKWLDDQSYADLVALSQFLPGPSSSQVGIGIGIMRAGLTGGILAFLGFTLPSVLLLILFAFLLQGFDVSNAGWIHGLKIVAVAVVAHALIGMSAKLTPDTKRRTIALFALIVSLMWVSVWSQVTIIIISGFVGYLLYKGEEKAGSNLLVPISKRFAVICLVLFFSLLIILPIMAEVTSVEWITFFDSFYRAGSLVFGGGHVVLPLLEQEFVSTGWLTQEEFLAGYGATQAVPGPLFSFAAYLGAVIAGWEGAIIATVAIFLPAFLLILGTLPFWATLRGNAKIQGALLGVNAGVVGILVAALYDPIWTSSIITTVDFVLATLLFGMLAFWKLPAWTVVLTGAVGGVLIGIVF